MELRGIQGISASPTDRGVVEAGRKESSPCGPRCCSSTLNLVGSATHLWISEGCGLAASNCLRTRNRHDGFASAESLASVATFQKALRDAGVPDGRNSYRFAVFRDRVRFSCFLNIESVHLTYCQSRGIRLERKIRNRLTNVMESMALSIRGEGQPGDGYSSTDAFRAHRTLNSKRHPRRRWKASSFCLVATIKLQGCSFIDDGVHRAASNRLPKASESTSLDAKALRLDSVGTSVGVQQKLMRHSDIVPP